MSIINRITKSYEDISSDLRSYLTSIFGEAGQTLSRAGGYATIIEILKSLFQFFLYQVRIGIRENNVLTAKFKKSIHGNARISGHVPYRGRGAKGTIRLKIKPTEVTANPQVTNKLYIAKGAQLRSAANDLLYYVDIPDDVVVLDVANTNYFDIPITEGEQRTESLVGNGQPLQSYNVGGGTNILISEEDIVVTVNGETFKIYEWLYDIAPEEKACVVRTGYNGGVDVIFGNSAIGYVPQITDQIVINYFVVNGILGNYQLTDTNTTFVFENGVFGDSSNNEEIENLEELIDLSLSIPPSLGSDGEEQELTRELTGTNSRSYVLAGVENYRHFLSRYSTIKLVNIYKDQNIINIFLTPDLSGRIYNTETYYTIPLERFLLSESEKTNLRKAIVDTESKYLVTESRIIDPIIRRYVAIVSIVKETIADEDFIRANVREIISDVIVNDKEVNFLAKSEFIGRLRDIKGVKAVGIDFKSEQNERAILDGNYVETIVTDILGFKQKEQRTITLSEGEDPNLGFDSEGNIQVSENDLPIIRGGFEVREGLVLEDSVYVIFT